ncbi:MAG: hypothetical protein RL699_742 [Bacteroidota bacterium]
MKAYPLKLFNLYYTKNKMKKVALLLSLWLIWSCNQKAETVLPETIETKTVAPKAVGSDKDPHGCTTSAGYTWSELRQECIRIFEVGTRFDPVEPNGMSAFVVMDTSGKQAELFTLQEKKPLILTQASTGTYTNGDWELHTQSKLARLIYKGKVAFIQPE